MAQPTFNGTALTTAAAIDQPGVPQPRVYTETMPGVDGEYAQPHGRGARMISVSGVLEANGDTAAAAHTALKTAVRSRMDLADGQTVATYIGTDGHNYTNCILISYEMAGPAAVWDAGATWTAQCRVTALLRQLTP